MKIIDRLIKKSRLYRELQDQRIAAKNRANHLEQENRELSERVDEISRKLCNVTVQRDTNYPRLRVCIDINNRILEQGFLHGDDELMIEYLGRHIGARAEQEIRRANFARWQK